MASPFKTSKAELVAIYRLEFYKKQKNWKYFSQERKKEEEKRKAARKALKAKLNQTYDIGPAPEQDEDVEKEAEELKDLNLAGIEEKQEVLKLEAEEESPVQPEDKVDDLNEAFVDTETEDTAILPAQPDSIIYPCSPKWSIQYWSAQRRRLWKQLDPSTHTQNTQFYPSQDAPVYPTQDGPVYPAQDGPVYPIQDIPVYPIQDIPVYPAQDGPDYPAQDIPLYPTQDTSVYPSQDTQAYLTPATHIYPISKLQVFPTQDSPNYAQESQVYSNQYYTPQKTQLYPHSQGHHKKITQVYPSARSQVYPTDPDHPNPYDPDLAYRADVPTFSPDLPQFGASVDAGGQHQYVAYEGWPRQTQMWTRNEWNEAEMGAEPGPTELAAGDAVDGAAPEGVLGRAQRWLSGSHLSSAARADSPLSVSSESFSRGAALAPHSTEIDLRISSSSEEMAGLSAAALAAAVARHAGALHSLLGEARKRDLTSPSIDMMHSFDDYPTRDVPSCTSTSSDVITGSIRNWPDLAGQTDVGASRGRGKRLYDTAVIGIGRGRPYRI